MFVQYFFKTKVLIFNVFVTFYHHSILDSDYLIACLIFYRENLNKLHQKSQKLIKFPSNYFNVIEK